MFPFIPLAARRFGEALVCPGSPELRDEVGRARKCGTWRGLVSALISVFYFEDT